MLSALSFTSPLVLLALLTLPVIWLLLRATPPAPKRIAFPPFIILRKLNASIETPVKTPWPLLALRLALGALIILGLAGPVWNAPKQTASPSANIIVLDDSWAAAAHWRKRQNALVEISHRANANDRNIYLIKTTPSAIPREIAPLTGEELRDIADKMTPRPFAADRADAMTALAQLRERISSEAEVEWLTDAVAGRDDEAFAETLRDMGRLTARIDKNAVQLMVRPADGEAAQYAFQVQRLEGGVAWKGELIAMGRDGRELQRIDLSMAPGETSTVASVDLPLALRNELASVRIAGANSAGGVHFIDARNRRALVGITASGRTPGNNLLAGSHYIKQALAPYAEFVEGPINDILTSQTSVFVLDDIGALRPSESAALRQWVEQGGVLIRFAGPYLAEAALSGEPALLPTPLRGGGRAFGGALTWETPQPLDAFASDGPFHGLLAPQDVKVRQQVLAQPGGVTTERTWARLRDGTPLVTGERIANGAIVLFHVTATPEWSDLPISELFIHMLRRLTAMSAIGADALEQSAQTRFPIWRAIDGFGRLRRPGVDAPALTAAQIDEPPSPARRPGLYGAPDAPLAVNAVAETTSFSPLTLRPGEAAGYENEPPRRLGAPLFWIALMALIADGLFTLALSGRLRMPAIQAVLIAALAVGALSPAQSVAQPLDPPIDDKTVAAALETRLAFVKTGDATLDQLSGQALRALSRELTRRTSVEPAPPDMVDPETDDLSVYPFLYWPLTADAPPLSDAALSNVETFMRFGGLILFDTRDGERYSGPGSTPESAALQSILRQLDIPALSPIEGEHVLLRSFYLLNALYGRYNNTPVWAQAADRGENDGVTALIIGGGDWAGAWASDELGRPMRPMPSGGERAREFAYRSGVNIVMVAFTGNYKSDQVHTPILLERLGR